MLAPGPRASTARRTAGPGLSQPHEAAPAHLEPPPAEVLEGQLPVRIVQRGPVQAHPTLLDQPPGLGVRRGETESREHPRHPHALLADRLRGDRRLRYLLGKLMLTVHAIEAPLGSGAFPPPPGQ